MKTYFVEKYRELSSGDSISCPLASLDAAESCANISGPKIIVEPYEGTLRKLEMYGLPRLVAAYGEVNDDPADYDAIYEVTTTN